MLTQVFAVVCHNAVRGYNERASSEGDRARDKWGQRVTASTAVTDS